MDDRFTEAFAAAPRADFLTAQQRHNAHIDAPLPIGHGATNSQPSTVLLMLRLLDPHPGDRVLDVGSGSGWTSALLGELVGPTGSVTGVDIVPALVAVGRANLGDRWPWVRIRLARRDVMGWPDGSPYDRILVSADGGSVPRALEDQLAPGGRMVLPAAQEMTIVERSTDGALTRRHAPGLFSFVRLR
ncbi:protein-L-isoaspartate O-methyltransferase family protein [Tessaracoccus lapidicaptus]|uniref:protein-L-isoaspartate O-methyltransferase family protein n=1 Tax=Tessaracoccus lapidicaptus TaxID=1427523 RepID=UPI003342B055